jgi:hypothetical protein
VNDFAQQLAERIKGNPAFWDDIDTVFSKGLQALMGGLHDDHQSSPEDTHTATLRLIEAALAFSQSPEDRDRNLAQGIALYAPLTSSLPEIGEVSASVLANIGNFPGADRLAALIGDQTTSLSSYLRNSLLRTLNTVHINEKDFYLTNFQRNVWDRLSDKVSSAISAPTSAGKSFVVLEHLCTEAISAERFVAVFVAPTRALLGEIYSKISNKLDGQSTTIRVSTIPTLDAEQRPKQIFVLTQERLQVLLAVSDMVFDLVIVDEAQSIGDEARGMILQDCLEELRRRGASTRFLFLAPGATGFQALEQAIGLESLAVENTELSPVVQNRIIVGVDKADANKLHLSLLSDARRTRLGVYKAERGFENQKTRLAAVALELGRTGGSLVYGTGPANAETVAGQIASGLGMSDRPALTELSKFIQQHVHKRYSLASHVLKGVAFHYGKMPGLLREAIEEAFKANELSYLACTTTLFQGVNLPARNVFIDTPTRGNRGDKLDTASLWNFAGRAGRLGHDICGNVFLVDYDSWDEKPLDERKAFSINPSFKSTVVEKLPEVLQRLNGQGNSASTPYSTADAAAGLLISRAARGNLSSFLARTLAGAVPSESIEELEQAAQSAYSDLDLPPEVIQTNWTVDPFGQARLLNRFREVIGKGRADELIPIHPSGNVYSLYVRIFSRINKYILGQNSSRFSNKLAATGLSWMKGKPLPQLISDSIRYGESSRNEGSISNIDPIVRNVFDFVEDTLRFKYVQLGRAYVDLLKFALVEAGQAEKAKTVYDFPLALELGVSTTAGQAFIELGLSRITASTLENLIPNSAPTAQQASEWLAQLTGREFPLSKVILGELVRKGFLKSYADQ